MTNPMPNTDPYPLHQRSDTAPTRADIARSLLWVLVVLSAVGNMAASVGGAHSWVNLCCGAVTVLAGGTLVVRSLRGRR